MWVTFLIDEKTNNIIFKEQKFIHLTTGIYIKISSKQIYACLFSKL